MLGYDWPEIYISAASAGEVHQEVHIKTLSAAMLDPSITHKIPTNDRRQIKEFVDVSEDGIMVVLNRKRISDADQFVAADMVGVALDQLNDTAGQVFFGSWITPENSRLIWPVN